MDSLIAVIVICIVIPLALSLIFLDKKARRFIEFMIIGALICTFASSVNSFLYELSGMDYYYVTTNITPISEEVLKAFPVLLFAYAVTDDKKTLLSSSMAVGIGFAVVENILIFIQNDSSLSVIWAIQRVFGASLMHGICTASVGYGISFVKKRKKLFYTGTFALLVLAMVYHSVYNSVIQSAYLQFGIFIPILTYIPVVTRFIIDYKKTKIKNTTAAAVEEERK